MRVILKHTWFEISPFFSSDSVILILNSGIGQQQSCRFSPTTGIEVCQLNLSRHFEWMTKLRVTWHVQLYTIYTLTPCKCCQIVWPDRRLVDKIQQYCLFVTYLHKPGHSMRKEIYFITLTYLINVQYLISVQGWHDLTIQRFYWKIMLDFELPFA